MKDKQPRKDKPTPIRLGDYKIPLREEASRQDRSMHYLVLRAVENLPCVQEFIKGRLNGR